MSNRWIEAAAVLLMTLLLGACATPRGGSGAAGGALPEAAKADFAVAVAALEEGRYRVAEAALNLALEHAPGHALLLLNRGIARRHAGDAEAARADLTAVLARHPQQAEAHNQLGVLAREGGEFAAAEEHYRAALAGDPGYADAHYNMGVLCEIYLRRADCALRHYREYLALRSDAVLQRWVEALSRRSGSAGGEG